MVSYDSLRVFVDSICPFNADSIAWHLFFYKSKLIKYDRKSGYAFYKGHYENTKVETVSRWGKVKSGIWIGYRNGKYYNSYDGGEKTRYQSDEKPGGKGFEYRTLWDRIKSCF